MIAHEYKQMLMSITNPLKQEIMLILLRHIGRGEIIRRVDLLAECRTLANKNASDDRRMQAAINELRHEGFLICSNAGEGEKGYFLPANLEEYSEFEEHELNSKIRSYTQTRDIMRRSAQAQLGRAMQRELF